MDSSQERPRRLEGQVVIVTGASSGIGSGLARGLAKEGAKVALAARRLDRLDDLRNEIVSHGDVAVAVKTDVTKRAEVKELVKRVECSLGPVDVLINCAGVMYYNFMKNVNEDEWEHEVDINCKGVLNGIGAVLPGMLERRKGHIVNVSSDAGRKVFPGLTVYSATKFFVEAISQGLRLETAGTGIKVTSIQPGDVETELRLRTTDDEAREKFDMSTKMKILTPEDISNAVIFALAQPPYCAVNEILVEPVDAPC